jgi:hypothetical protein
MRSKAVVIRVSSWGKSLIRLSFPVRLYRQFRCCTVRLNSNRAPIGKA